MKTLPPVDLTDPVVTEVTTETEMTISSVEFVELLFARVRAIFNGKTKLDKFSKKQRQVAESDFHMEVMKLLESEEGIPLRLNPPATVTVAKEATYEELRDQFILLSCGDNEILKGLSLQTFKIAMMYIEALRDILTWEEFEQLFQSNLNNFSSGKSKLIPANLDLIYSLGKDKILSLVAGETIDPAPTVNPDEPDKQPMPTVVRPELDLDTIGWDNYETNAEEALVKLVNSGKIIEYLHTPGTCNFPMYELVLNYVVENMKLDEDFLRYELVWLEDEKLEEYKEMERKANLFI